MMKTRWLFGAGIAATLWSAAMPCQAMTPLELKKMLDRGDTVTIIDIRGQAQYTEGHIPGAINIPASVIGKKHLPAFGFVVVYGDGVRTDLAIDAMLALKDKKGITAEMLDGGFGAWQTMKLTTTQEKGLSKAEFQHLSYQELEQAAKTGLDLVLVDLREDATAGQEKQAGQSGAPIEAQAGGPLTDLSQQFPYVKTVQLVRKTRGQETTWDLSTLLSAKGKAEYQKFLYVLIDRGDGESENLARRLNAHGIKRIGVLTGGEISLQRKGAPGALHGEIRQEIR